MAMFVPASLKSPYVLGILGLSTSLVFGLGAGQIYEESNPTLDKQLSRNGYSYSPVEAPNEEKPKNKKFNGSGWGCVKRLFPDLGVKYDDAPPGANESSSNNPLNSTTSNANKFISCAIMELHPSTPPGENIETRFKNRIYFKSEVVVKGSDYGGIIGTGLSTFPKKINSGKYENELEFIYRLLELKKHEEKGVVNRGLGGNNLWAQSFYNDRFIIAPPIDQSGGFTKEKSRKYVDNGDFEKKLGAGIGEVDESKESKEKDILGSISIYPNSVNEAELGGSNGEFNMFSAGYTYSQIVYINDKGWKNISKGNNLSSELKEWYSPFKGKKIKGTDLSTRCYSGSGQRNKNVASEEEDLRNLCYQSPKI